ncbi:MAG: glycosyltransferase family 2 protein [Solirubrobacterales bacterium]
MAVGPEITVVVPTLGRRTSLLRAVERLLAQADAPPFELLIVRDAAADGEHVGEAIARMPADSPAMSWRLLEATRPGASAARNAGWREATAPLVLFVDDDVLAGPGLLRRHVEAHAAHPETEVAVLGLVTWARELRVTPFMRWLEQGIQFDYGAITGPEADIGKFTTANLSLKRVLLADSGGFDEVRFPYLWEDIELGWRLSHRGLRLRYEPRAFAEHLHQVDVDAYLERMRLVARGERRLVETHPELEAQLYDRFRAALARPAPHGRGARLAHLVPEATPWLGPRVWASAAAVFERRLAGPYVEAFDEASKPGGS